MKQRFVLYLCALVLAGSLCSCGAGVHISVGTPGNNSFEWGISTPGGDSYGNMPAPGSESPDSGEPLEGL